MADVGDAETIEYFYGVYLLCCSNPQYRGRTYIGFTVDPNRRLKQHNKGKDFGGAWRTSNRGPWKMVLIVHGFPNDVTALRFEWAWQHPTSSRRLKHVPRKRRFEKTFDYCLRILSEMLRVGPWSRLPLTVRWLEENFQQNFPPDKIPPIHMSICYGPVASKQLKKPLDSSVRGGPTEPTDNTECYICGTIVVKGLNCLYSSCDISTHIICLSQTFTKIGQYIPIVGACPKCNRQLLWGDLIRKYRGCYDLNEHVRDSVSDSEHF